MGCATYFLPLYRFIETQQQVENKEECRCNNVYNEKPHGYDIIWGVMSDNRPDQIVLSYKEKSILYDEAIEKLQKPNSMKQLFVGNQLLCDALQIVSIVEGGVRDEDDNFGK